VLALFKLQAGILLARMRHAAPKAVAGLAHTLTGSARGVGAWNVAAAAEKVEQLASAPGAGPLTLRSAGSPPPSSTRRRQSLSCSTGADAN